MRSGQRPAMVGSFTQQPQPPQRSDTTWPSQPAVMPDRMLRWPGLSAAQASMACLWVAIGGMEKSV